MMDAAKASKVLSELSDCSLGQRLTNALASWHAYTKTKGPAGQYDGFSHLAALQNRLAISQRSMIKLMLPFGLWLTVVGILWGVQVGNGHLHRKVAAVTGYVGAEHVSYLLGCPS